MKKFSIVMLAIAIVAMAILPMFAANESAPYVPLRGNGTTIAKGISINDSTTSTVTAQKIVAFKSTAVAGVAAVKGLGFKGKDTYVIILDQQGNTFSATAATVQYDTGNSCSVYTSDLTAVVRGVAIGY